MHSTCPALANATTTWSAMAHLGPGVRHSNNTNIVPVSSVAFFFPFSLFTERQCQDRKKAYLKLLSSSRFLRNPTYRFTLLAGIRFTHHSTTEPKRNLI